MTAQDVIQRFNLVPLPGEGGFYRETFRTKDSGTLPSRPGIQRAFGTWIYYLLTPDTFSALHRLKSDEVYHFYRGCPVELTMIDERGELKKVVLGSVFESGHVCQQVVPAGIWQGSRLIEGGEWALMGTSMAPGFEFEDCELADEKLASMFPKHSEHIRKLLPVVEE